MSSPDSSHFCSLFFLIFIFIYLFSLFFWLRQVFVAAHGLLSICGAWAPGRVGSVVCGTVGSLVEVCELNSCGAWA